MFGLGKLFKRKEPTVEEVAQALRPLLQALRPAVTFAFEPGLDVIRCSDGAVISLANLHADYLRTPVDQRHQVLSNFAMGILPAELPETFSEAKDRLLPALRNLPGLDQARILAGEFDLQTLMLGMRPFSDTLMVAVVHDTEFGMQQVSNDTMRKWGVSVDALHQVAIDNLRHKAPPTFKPISPGLYASDYGDYYDAARILLPELAYQLGLPGNPVAMAPNRICLLVASDQDSPALLAMVEKSREILASESRPLGAEMFRMTDGQWRMWTPTDEVAAKALHDLQSGMLSSDYAAQKQVLDDAHQKSGKDVFVASHTVVQRQDGRLVSYSVLTKGVDTWLPRSDVVVFVDPENPKATKKIVEWAAFEGGAGHLIDALSHVPKRYHVKEHPSDELIAGLPDGVL
jgi:hypothetical protein